MSVYDLYNYIAHSLHRWMHMLTQVPTCFELLNSCNVYSVLYTVVCGGKYMYKALCRLLFTHTNMFCIKVPVTTPLTYSIIGILSANFLAQIILSHPNILMTLDKEASIMQLHQIAATWIMVFLEERALQHQSSYIAPHLWTKNCQDRLIPRPHIIFICTKDVLQAIKSWAAPGNEATVRSWSSKLWQLLHKVPFAINPRQGFWSAETSMYTPHWYYATLVLHFCYS